MKGLLYIFLLLTTAGTATAQTTPLFQAGDLRLEWELVQNQYQEKSQSLSILRLSNTGKKNLPTSGWSLYFNFGRKFAAETGQAEGFPVEHLSGDWYRMRPAAPFQGIASGKTLEVRLVSQDWLVNRTDAPYGFYVVFDAAPEKGYATPPVEVRQPAQPERLLRAAADKTAFVTPADVFQQNADTRAVEAAAVFPTPVSVTPKAGTYRIDAGTSVSFDPAFEREARLLASEWKQFFGTEAAVSTRQIRGISLRKTATPGAPESYTLDISPENGIVIEATDAAGAFYGLQSLKSMLPIDCWKQASGGVDLPCLRIADQPRFGYRGLHVDIARNFQPATELLKLLDAMALYKLNKLHLHFSDDEGWRIEIPGLPELTEVGSRRGHASTEKNFLHPSYGSGPETGKAVGSGHYTRAEFIRLLRYATERHIEVIPEIELPGHARAAIKSMDARYERLMAAGRPEEARQYLLRDLSDGSQYESVQYYDDNVVCVGLPSTYAFIEKVTDELVVMYREAGAPISTVHLGGDEVPGGVWEKSPACQQVLRERQLGGTDDLWYYFWGKMQDMLRVRGLDVSAWEEAGLRKTKLDGAPHYLPNPDFATERPFRVYVWNNVLGWGAEDLAYRMANAGYKVILGPVSNLYFDMAYQKEFNEPGYYWGAYTDVDKAFGFIPFDYFKNSSEDRFGNPIDPAIFVGKSRLTDYGKSNILGIQGLIWAETLTGPEALEYMVFPKLLGLAERAWSPAPVWETTREPETFRNQYQQSWLQFASQLGQRELPRLDYLSGGFNYRIPTPGVEIRDGVLHANIQLPGFTLRYTTDGSEPTPSSTLYTGPTPVKGQIKMAAFSHKGRKSRTAHGGR